jgi:hypothetical protein
MVKYFYVNNLSAVGLVKTPTTSCKHLILPDIEDFELHIICKGKKAQRPAVAPGPARGCAAVR